MFPRVDRIDSMPVVKYSEECKVHVVCEVSEQGGVISSVPSLCDLVLQALGNWVASYGKECAADLVRQKVSESAEIEKLEAENRWLCQESEFRK